MITLTGEVVCDTCKQVVASGEPAPAEGDNSYWIWSACHAAEEKAKAHGAHIGISRVLCADCLAKQQPQKTWIIETT